MTLRVGPQGRVPAGLRHRYIVVEEARKLIVACRQLRLDLQRCCSGFVMACCPFLAVLVLPFSAPCQWPLLGHNMIGLQLLAIKPWSSRPDRRMTVRVPGRRACWPSVCPHAGG